MSDFNKEERRKAKIEIRERTIVKRPGVTTGPIVAMVTTRDAMLSIQETVDRALMSPKGKSSTILYTPDGGEILLQLEIEKEPKNA
jgi:hypothetical protein